MYLFRGVYTSLYVPDLFHNKAPHQVIKLHMHVLIHNINS